MFIWGITEGLTRNTTSEIALRDCCKELWEVPEFLPKKKNKPQKPGSQNQKITAS